MNNDALAEVLKNRMRNCADNLIRIVIQNDAVVGPEIIYSETLGKSFNIASYKAMNSAIKKLSEGKEVKDFDREEGLQLMKACFESVAGLDSFEKSGIELNVIMFVSVP